MTGQSGFTPRDFLALVKELNEHEAELKIRLTKAGDDQRAKGQTSSTSRP